MALNHIFLYFSGNSGSLNDEISDQFVYEEDRDRYRCSAGEYLQPLPTPSRGVTLYRSDPTICEACPLQTSCKAPRRGKSSTRVVRRNEHQKLYEEVKAEMYTPEFDERMRERMWKVEGIFAEAKQYHCLRRAKYRGLKKVQIQAYLCACALNIKRLVNALLDSIMMRLLAIDFI